MVNALDIVAGAAVLLVLGGIVAYVVVLYNRLVRVRRRAENAWADIDVLLKQRRETLEKLVDAAQESMAFEEDVLTEIAALRDQEQQAQTPREEAETGEAIRQTVANFDLRAEDYPELKSGENMLQLQEEISNLEQQIADRREVYNKAATRQNTLVQSFPYLLFARMFGYGERELYQVSPEDTADVDVSEIAPETGADAATAGE